MKVSIILMSMNVKFVTEDWGSESQTDSFDFSVHLSTKVNLYGREGLGVLKTLVLLRVSSFQILPPSS